MKKTSKLFSAVALSATLAIGTAVPAFAAPHDSDDPNHIDPAVVDETTTNEFDVQNTGQSKVQIAAEVGQLNATIPLKVKVVATTTGGPLLHVPAGALPTAGDATTGTATWVPADTGAGTPGHYDYSGFYRIENHSNDIDIRVTSIEASVDANANWEYKTQAGLTSATTVTAGKQGAVNLSINGVNIDNSDTDTGSKKLPTTGDTWKINKYNSLEGTHSALPLLIDGSTSALTGTFVNGIGGNPANGSVAIQDTDDIILTYTIQIA